MDEAAAAAAGFGTGLGTGFATTTAAEAGTEPYAGSAGGATTTTGVFDGTPLCFASAFAVFGACTAGAIVGMGAFVDVDTSAFAVTAAVETAAAETAGAFSDDERVFDRYDCERDCERERDRDRDLKRDLERDLERDFE